MIGAIIGDIVGSRFEFNNHRSKDFELFSDKCFFTDDTIMSLAVCHALMHSSSDRSDLPDVCVSSMQTIGRPYPHCGYGGRFHGWIYSDHPEPYNSFGNGSAMRVGGCGWVGNSIDEVRQLSHAVTAVTHNHPEGLKGAEATAVAIYLARTGSDIQQIRSYITEHYYKIDFTIDGIRDTYMFNETCQDTVPQALQAFFESRDFEDALRIAISTGGDSDTLAAITCSVAEAYYGVPQSIRKSAESYLDKPMMKLLRDFESKWPGKEA